MRPVVTGSMMIPSLVLSIAVVIFLILCAFIYGQAAYQRAVGCGQSGLVALLLGAAVPAAGASLPVVLTFLLWSGVDKPSPSGDLTPVLLVVASAVAGLGAAAGGWWLSAKVPKHRGRPGLRPLRHHYTGWANAVAWLTLPAAVAAGLASSWSNALKVVPAGISATSLLRYYARRHTDQVEVLPADGVTQSVLLLRPFDADWETNLSAHSSQTSWADSNRGAVTFEQFIADEMRERIGPMVALGSPRDRLPPGGATRVYLDNETWQQQFLDLARHVKVIVMIPGDSDNISVELREIARNGLQPRLAVVTPPRPQRRFAVAQQLSKLLIALQSRLIPRPATWPGFAARLRDTGYRHVPDDPGPGAILTFDASGETRVAAGNVTDPAAIVAAIADTVGA
jgi:hypothetical protein